MKKTYMVRWHDTGTRGFGSQAAAQKYIDRICMTVAPNHDYDIAEEF